jgi:hypothetical protein
MDRHGRAILRGFDRTLITLVLEARPNMGEIAE